MAYVNANEIRAKVVRHEMSQDSITVAELAVGGKGVEREGLGRLGEIQEMDGTDMGERDKREKR